jgi:histidinol-phosphate aminotransferase
VNFLLVRVEDPDRLYAFLHEMGVIVRNRSRLTHCEGCLRITVGTPDENDRLIELMKSYSP